jgi:lipase chaperone LimK
MQKIKLKKSCISRQALNAVEKKKRRLRLYRLEFPAGQELVVFLQVLRDAAQHFA